MECLYTSIHHLRSTGVLGYIHHLHASITHGLRSSSSGQQLHSVGFQELGKIHKSGLVRDRENGTLHLEK